MGTTVRSKSPQSDALALAPAPSPAPAVAPGSRWESAWLALLLAGDLLATPVQLVLFLCTRRRQRQRLLDELRHSAR